MFRLLPRNLDFFNLFERASKNAVRAAELLIEFAGSNPKENIELLGAIKEREHAGDNLTHETLDRLEKTYVTPFDRDDIQHLATELDDIVDHIQSVAVRLHIYRSASPRRHSDNIAPNCCAGARPWLRQSRGCVT